MAKQTLTGVVSMVSEKEWTDRDTGEDIFLYSFQIEGDKRYFRTGTDDPGVDEGEAIRFAFDTKGNNVDVKTVEVIDESEVEAAPKPRRGRSEGRGSSRSGSRNSTGGRSGGQSKSSGKSTENWDARAKYWADKEVRDIEVVEPRITLCAARRDAIALVASALSEGCISFGKATGAKKLDIVLDAVDLVTARFYDQTMSGNGVSSPEVADGDYDEEE